jgi:ribonuclease D
MPKDLEQLQRIRGLPAATRQRYGEALLARIAAARAEPPEQWPIRPRRLRLTREQSARVDDLLDLIATRANEHGIPPQGIADRRDVENLLVDEDSPLRHGWRAAVVGRELQARLATSADP